MTRLRHAPLLLAALLAAVGPAPAVSQTPDAVSPPSAGATEAGGFPSASGEVPFAASPGTGVAPSPLSPVLPAVAPPPAGATGADAAAPGPLSPAALPDLPVFRQFASLPGARLVPLGPAGGMEGWLVITGARRTTVYVTPDRTGLVVGVLYDAEGQLLTDDQLAALPPDLAPGAATVPPASAAAPPAGAPPPGAPPAAERPFADIDPAAPMPAPAVSPEAFWAELEREVAWFPIGNADAPPLYVFLDPMCPYCQRYWTDLHLAHIQAGRVQLRVIPVGLVTRESFPASARLLSIENPAEAYAAFESGQRVALAGEPSAAGVARLQGNHAFMGRYNIRSVPFSIYRSGATGEVRVVHDRPRDVPGLIADLRGGR